MRTNWKNDGRAFQKEIELTAIGYLNRGIAKLEKVDPPVRIIGGGPSRRVIFLANPWLDWAGTWTEKYGRSLFIESKSTSTHRLAIGKDGGLTASQWAAMRQWRIAGAACAVVWQYGGAVALLLPETIAEAIGRKEASIPFEVGLRVPRGDGKVVWDFLNTLSEAIWPAVKKEAKSLESGADSPII
jgi:hypothetical protein